MPQSIWWNIVIWKGIVSDYSRTLNIIVVIFAWCYSLIFLPTCFRSEHWHDIGHHRAIHALGDIIFVSCGAVQIARVLYATVWMNDRSFQFRLHVGIHCQIKNTRIKAIKNGRKVEFAVMSFNLCHVSDTRGQQLIRLKVTFQKIVWLTCCRICFGNAVWLTTRTMWVSPISRIMR